MTSTTEDVSLPDTFWQALKTANTAARDILKHRDRASWLLVGEGLYAIRAEALRLAGTDNVKSNDYRDFQRVLMEKAPRLSELALRDHAGCQHAVWMYENWDKLKEWIDGLPPKESIRLNHPTSIWRRYNRAERTWDEPTPQRHRIEHVEDLEREYPELMEELREDVEAQVRRERSQGIMTRDTFDKLVVCLEQSTAEAAPEMLEVVRKLGWMLVREEAKEDLKEPESV